MENIATRRFKPANRLVVAMSGQNQTDWGRLRSKASRFTSLEPFPTAKCEGKSIQDGVMLCDRKVIITRWQVDQDGSRSSPSADTTLYLT